MQLAILEMSVRRRILAIQIGNRMGATQKTEVNRWIEGPVQKHWSERARRLDNPERPPEPVAQVRVLPGAPPGAPSCLGC